MSVAQKFIPATIAAGQSLSNAVLLGDYTLSGILTPSNWTGAGGLSYQTSFDGGNTWFELNDSTGAAVSLPTATAASTYYAIDVRNPSLTGVTMIKIRSGSVGTPVNQTTASVLQVVGRRIYPGTD